MLKTNESIFIAIIWARFVAYQSNMISSKGTFFPITSWLLLSISYLRDMNILAMLIMPQ